MPSSSENANAAYMVMKEIEFHVTHMLAGNSILPFKRNDTTPKPKFLQFTLDDVDLLKSQVAATYFPILDDTGLCNRLAELVHILERGSHTHTRTHEPRRQELRNEIQDSSSVSWTCAFAIAAHSRMQEDEAEKLLSHRDHALLTAQREKDDLNVELANTRHLLAEQAIYAETLAEIHISWKDLVKGIRRESEAEPIGDCATVMRTLYESMETISDEVFEKGRKQLTKLA